MDRIAFEHLVDAAVAALPELFRTKLQDVAIIVKDRPPARRGRGHSARSPLLLGLYEGVPVTAWGHDHSGKIPDTISLFQANIEEYAELHGEDVRDTVRETLLHEIAHYFGFDHDRIHPMEKRWKRGRNGGKEGG